MVARKWMRLAEAVAEELDGASPARSLSQAPDEALLRASERCGLLLATRFHRPEDRLATIRHRLDEVRDAENAPAAFGDEDDSAAICRRLRAIAFRDTTNMRPTDRRTTAEALRALAVINRESRRRAHREKRESEAVRRPAVFDVEPVMCSRSILPEGPTPQELAERLALVESARPAPTFAGRLREQALEEQARMRAQQERQTQRILAEMRYFMARAARSRVDDTPRRVGMPGLGGM